MSKQDRFEGTKRIRMIMQLVKDATTLLRSSKAEPGTELLHANMSALDFSLVNLNQMLRDCLPVADCDCDGDCIRCGGKGWLTYRQVTVKGSE